MFAIKAVVGCIFLGTTVAALNCSKFPSKEDMLECCKFPGPMQDIVTKCTGELSSGGKLCHADCLLDSIGFSVIGQIQLDKVPTVIDVFFKDFPDFIPVAKASFSKCEEHAEEELPKMKEKRMEVGNGCDPLSSLVAPCFYIETVINCPPALWQNRDSCNETKEYLKHCSWK